eukprot:191980-Pleurochrysis_carterae.AAC.4
MRSARCAAGSVNLARAAAISGGHASETIHTRRGSSESRAYPPRPSKPLASVVTVAISNDKSN